MAAFTSAVQRRKTTRSSNNNSSNGSSNGSKARQSPSGSDESDRNQLCNNKSSNFFGEKPEKSRKQQQQSEPAKCSSTSSDITSSTTKPVRKGAAAPTQSNLSATSTAAPCINCCRDVNCYLNASLRRCAAPADMDRSAGQRHGVADSTTLECLNYQQQILQQQKKHSYNNNAARSKRSSSCLSTSSAASTSTTSTTYNAFNCNDDNSRRSHSPSLQPSPSAAHGTSVFGQGTQKSQAKKANSLCGAGVSSTNFLSSLADSEFSISVNFDLFSWILFILAFTTRFYKLTTPPNIVFDELHYGKYISHYIRNIFFFDQHPPLGKQLIAAATSFGSNYDGNYTFSRIGAEYSSNVPIFWLRFVPAFCGSILPTAVYKVLLEARLHRWSAFLGGLLIVFDNAMLTQSRFVLMESMLLLFGTWGIYCLLRFQRCAFGSVRWLVFGAAAAILLTCATTVKYSGFLTCCLAMYLMGRHMWDLLYDADNSIFQIFKQTLLRVFLFGLIPMVLYLSIFYIHLQTLNRAGPHDSVMTSAFQASLEGGLASITKGQPLKVVHGSQITLRHTHGRTCWLHSHAHVYPVRYPDKRGSSHQQQVTCYSFKDVNNWWIVKRPERDDLVVGDEIDPIHDGDVIQLVHGITSRALNSHDVAAPMTPQCQEVSCYIDYEIEMASELLWRVEILNKETEGVVWHAIKSEVRLVHTTTGAALRFSGRQLPDWGFNQHEVVADRIVENKDAVWNVEEHRYTKDNDERERERQLLAAEMIPTKKTKLTFWEKFLELQTKMLWNTKQIQSHMYSSEPIEWPFLDKGIAYWMDGKSNGQIHLLGNILIWYTGSMAVFLYAAFAIYYILRRRRLCFDLPAFEWQRFVEAGHIFFIGYLMHYLPYYFVDRTLFLHHYLPAFLFKIYLLCYMLELIDFIVQRFQFRIMLKANDTSTRLILRKFSVFVVSFYRLVVVMWFVAVLYVFVKFLPLSYGIHKLTADDVIKLRWKDSWDFILQKQLALVNDEEVVITP